MEHHLFLRNFFKTFFFAINLFFTLNPRLMSQSGLMDPYIRQLSPQAYDLIKYGNTNISYYSGETNIKIPIYTYKDKDFEIPIFLGYNSSGFIPNKRESIVGLNWFLNAGGVITRRVRGFPDDKIGDTTAISAYYLYGLYCGIKNSSRLISTSKDDIFSFSNNCGGVKEFYWDIDGYEVEPDEFTFSMPGFSGSFFINNDGTVKCSGNLPFRVDLSEFGTQPHAGITINNSKIVIITDDGYKYSFGGTIQFLEVSFPMNSDGTKCDGTNYVINAWHLNEIVAPNGRRVIYSYKEFVPGLNSGNHPPKDTTAYLANYYEVMYNCDIFQGSPPSTWFGQHFHVYDFGSHSYTGPQQISELTKIVYLEKIQIDATTINFFYSNKGKNFYSESTWYNKQTKKLDSINVKYNNNSDPIKRYYFDYKYLGGEHGERLFLTSFKESGQGPFSFEYYDTILIPGPKTNGIDYWGFWNGGYETNSNLLPQISIDTVDNSSYEYTSDEREPDTSKCRVGLLKKMIYPTGGSTSFYYEGHSYSKRLERKESTAFLPELYSVNGVAGGARIFRVVDNDGHNNQNIREFKYVKDNPDSATSSGILLDWPRYVYNYKEGDTYYFLQKSTSFNTNYYPDEKYIHYSEVFEICLPNNGYTQYKFTNYETNPNIHDIDTTVMYPAQYETIDDDNKELLNNYIGINLNNASFERGFPYEITNFAKINELYIPVKRISYDTCLFTRITDYPNNYSVGVRRTGGYLAQSYKLYYYPFLPKKKTITSYSNNGSSYIENITNYTFNDCGLIASESFSQSDSSHLTTTYTYPKDISFSTPDLHTICSLSMDDFEQDYNNIVTLSMGISDLEARKEYILSWWSRFPDTWYDEDGNFLSDNYYADCLTQSLPPLDNEASAVNEMNNKNMIDKPIQVVKTKNGNIVSAEYTKYLTQDSLTLPRTSYDIEIASPLSSLPLPSVPYVTTDGDYIKSSIFNIQNEQVYYDKYDTKGNILQFHKKKWV